MNDISSLLRLFEILSLDFNLNVQRNLCKHTFKNILGQSKCILKHIFDVLNYKI